MNNPRISVKERNLLKGAIRRVFSRSELRRRVMQAAKNNAYTNADRPRVKTWYTCFNCKNCFPAHEMNVDHIDPIIPLDQTLESLSWDTVVDRVWCEEHNLQVICLTCHKIKTKMESTVRKQHRKGLQLSTATNNRKKIRKIFKQIKEKGPKKPPQHTKALRKAKFNG